jgi:4-amino-4-deoxy-L-arabinose transferase-like glycosyltransferase
LANNDIGASKRYKILVYVFIFFALVVAGYVRIRLLDLPLERDEGEYAYIGQLMLKGFPPFAHAYNMKLPGVSIMYAIFMLVLGQTPSAIHFGFLLVNGFCIFLVYLLSLRLFDRYTAMICCVCYTILSLSWSVLGLVAHATHFVVLFTLAGLILLFQALEKRHILLFFISGLSFGIAFIMKQHAALFIIFAFIYLLWRNRVNFIRHKTRSIGDYAIFIFAVIIPYLLIVLWMREAGVFDKFWFWTVQYAREYGSTPSISKGISSFYEQLSLRFTEQPFLWSLAIIGIASGSILLIKKGGIDTDRPFIFGLLLSSLLSMCPGFYFRDHYFVLILPAISLMIGSAVFLARRSLVRLKYGVHLQFIPLLLVIISILLGVILEKNCLFKFNSLEVSRYLYAAEPFIESVKIGQYIKTHSSPGDLIAVVGSEPEIYFYADRLSATGYLYMNSLQENQPYAKRMQKEMFQEIESSVPKYIIVTSESMKWFVSNSQGNLFWNWVLKLYRDYDLVGVIDLINFNTTRYLWDNEAIGYKPISNAYINVYKRKDGAQHSNNGTQEFPLLK